MHGAGGGVFVPKVREGCTLTVEAACKSRPPEGVIGVHKSATS